MRLHRTLPQQRLGRISETQSATLQTPASRPHGAIRFAIAPYALFACGNDIASIMRGTYPGPGITLGSALVFGYRAAMAVAPRADSGQFALG
jgi:hypothetical protein